MTAGPVDPLGGLAAWMAARPPLRPARHMPRVSSGARGRYFLVRCPSCRGTEYQMELFPPAAAPAAPLRVTCEGCGVQTVAGLLEAPGGPEIFQDRALHRSYVVCSITAIAA